jgi:tetratricopeptide (TPR) repeat protein
MQKRYDEAERNFEQALKILAGLGPEHPDRAAALTLYARLLRDTHRRAEADRMLAEARRIRQGNALADGGRWVVDARVGPVKRQTAR